MPRRLAHFLACGAIFAVVGGAGYLSFEAIQADRHDPRFAASVALSEDEAARAIELAGSPDGGIPPSGAGDLLKTDPLTRGMALLKQKCLGCHAYGETQPAGESPMRGWNLRGYASEQWVRDLLANPGDPRFTGHVPKAAGSKETSGKALSGMQKWKADMDLEPEERDRVAAFLATFAKTGPGITFEEWSADPAIKQHPGYEDFVSNCCQCHAVGDWGEKTKINKAPSLFGYGAPQWIGRMIQNPGAKGYYGYLKPHEQMPSFGDQLTPRDLEMVVRLLTGDYLHVDLPKDRDKAASH